jgi:hypothetical protein
MARILTKSILRVMGLGQRPPFLNIYTKDNYILLDSFKENFCSATSNLTI